MLELKIKTVLDLQRFVGEFQSLDTSASADLGISEELGIVRRALERASRKASTNLSNEVSGKTRKPTIAKAGKESTQPKTTGLGSGQPNSF